MDFKQVVRKYQSYLRQEYRKKSTRRNYYRFAERALEWIQENRNKDNVDELTPEDIGDYKAYCMDRYEVNGNVGRLHALNNFTCKFLKRKDLKVSVPATIQVNKPIMSEKELETYINATNDPLEYMIAIMQIDGLLRPTEICMLKISNIDFENRKLYIDDSKTGDNYIIMSPRLVKAIKNYLPYRLKPKTQKDDDRLIIIPKGSHKGLAPQKGRGDFVYNTTKRIAARAGFKRSIYPYLIKPSAITIDLNNRVNPKIVQRKARHKRIESTLRYDHTSDEMVLRHYQAMQQDDQPDYDNDTSMSNPLYHEHNMTPKTRVEKVLDRYLAGEMDEETFKKTINLLSNGGQPTKYDIAYR